MRWSVGAKIGTGFGIGLAILLIFGINAYRSTASLLDAMQWQSHTLVVIGDIENILAITKDGEIGERGYIITGRDEYLEPYENAQRDIGPMLKTLRELTADNPNQQRRLDMLQPLLDQRFTVLREGVATRRDKGLEGAANVVLSGNGKRVMDSIRGVIGEMIAEEKSLLKVREERLNSDASQTIAIIVVGIPLAFVLLGVISWFITRNIARPLGELAGGAELIAAGDLSMQLKISATRADEVGELLRAFDAMVRSLRGMAAMAASIAAGDIRSKITPHSERDILGNAFAAMVQNLRSTTQEINEGVNVLVSAAAEILASTTQVAAGSAETATAVSQTTSTVEEVKQTAQLTAEKAKLVADNAQAAVQISQSGRQSVQQSIDAMQRIQNQMETIGESIVRLSEQGQTIGEIIATVNDLAEQSNLLAVNATIEAAKAGEQGKGFAVVAQEVKSLAAQSKLATAQVRNILGDIQKATSATVLTAEQGGREVAAGDKLSAQLGDAIRGLGDSVDAAARAATQIAASSKQQLIGMDQVALAMQNIREASAQNVASTKQTEVAAQNLHQLGLRLKQLVERYQV
jgi:methyl-accepting chemotaxis protein